MRPQKCANGHFYDADKYSSCPHCGAAAPAAAPAPASTPWVAPAAEDVTVAVHSNAAPAAPAYEDVTVPVYSNPVTPSASDFSDVTVPVRMDATTPAQGYMEEDEKTIAFDYGPIPGAAESNGSKAAPFEPVVGWLICIKGKHVGKDFRLTAGRNSVGRSESNDVALSGEVSVSREGQLAVVFEPQSNRFFAVPGNSKSLAYINGDVLLSKEELKKNDRLELGDVSLMFVPCCDASFNWKQIF